MSSMISSSTKAFPTKHHDALVVVWIGMHPTIIWFGV
jgi:hypothetical protein